MSVELAELLKPIDWERCQEEFPDQADALSSLITLDPISGAEWLKISDATPQKLNRHRDDAERASLEAASKAKKKLLQVRTELERLIEDHLDNVDEHVRIFFRTESEEFYWEYSETFMALDAIEDGLACLTNQHPARRGRPQKTRARLIAEVLAELYALDQNVPPTITMSVDGAHPTSAYAKLLVKVFRVAGEEIADLKNLTGEICNKLTPDGINALRRRVNSPDSGENLDAF